MDIKIRSKSLKAIIKMKHTNLRKIKVLGGRDGKKLGYGPVKRGMDLFFF